MLLKFCAVILFTPAFLFPGVLVAVLGGWCGQIYIAAQLSVKREMSNAKAPVLGQYVFSNHILRDWFTDENIASVLQLLV